MPPIALPPSITLPLTTDALRLTAAGLATIAFGTFAVGTYRVFRRGGPEPLGFQGVKVGTALAAALTLAALLRPSIASAYESARLTVACIAYALSVALFLWTAATVRGVRLPLIFAEPTPPAIVAHGPYRYFRHPFYVSYGTAYAAGAVATGVWWVTGVSLAMVGVYVVAAARESKALRRDLRLGAAYARYRAGRP
jgi:protein-S-isoprenylcysteine O-methyltransferase Ste14